MLLRRRQFQKNRYYDFKKVIIIFLKEQLLSLFNFKKAIIIHIITFTIVSFKNIRSKRFYFSLILTFRMIDRIYPQNLNINFDVLKFRYINIKTSTRFVVIIFMTIKLSNIF